jgi:arylsulfatase A-like enzyme
VPSFNEGDISDKPAWLRRAPLLDGGTISAIDALYRARQETLLSVEDLIADLLDVLTRSGELDNTWIFVTSDNGTMHGQHRMSGGKGIVYDESIAVPLSVRGPGTTGSRVVEEIVANIDFVPTLLELAGAPIPDSVDGRSFAPLLRGTASDWRGEVLVQSAGTGAPLRSPAFTGVRSRDYVYAEYAGGEPELYDLRNDPFQLDNGMRLGADPAIVDQLAARLAALRDCAGQACRDN